MRKKTVTSIRAPTMINHSVTSRTRLFMAIVTNYLNDFEKGRGDSIVMLYRTLSSFSILSAREKESVLEYLRERLKSET